MDVDKAGCTECLRLIEDLALPVHDRHGKWPILKCLYTDCYDVRDHFKEHGHSFGPHAGREGP